MQTKENILEKANRAFRQKVKAKLIEKIKDISGIGRGETLYFRPFRDDDKLIGEIAQATGAKKSEIAQKLLHLVLSTSPSDSARENRNIELLQWLVSNEKHKSAERDVQIVRIERLEEHAREMEVILRRTDENCHFTRILISEIYCLTNICMSYLNQIFTKLIEYFSPVEIEKKNSTDFANRNVLGLVEHSLTELKKIAEHHELDDESIEPEMLYLFTKIEKLKTRLLPPTVSANSEQK